MAVAFLFYGSEAPERYVYADIKGFYANIQHKWLMKHVPVCKEVLSEFLSAGHIFAEQLFPAKDSGISEGSPLSPMVSNFALDGLQRAIYDGIHGRSYAIDRKNGAMVRYADDVIVAVRSEEDARAALWAIENFLKPRGLVMSDEKTTTGTARKGFDMVGFTIKKEKYGMVIRPMDSVIERFKAYLGRQP